MQYEQIEPGNRVGLPRPSIDTGMGLERMPPHSSGPWSMKISEHGPHGPVSPICQKLSEVLMRDRFLEFWNLVFMQYEQIEPGNRVGLPRPSIDTGMGPRRGCRAGRPTVPVPGR
jgi:alanyl-tRNA synthetase